MILTAAALGAYLAACAPHSDPRFFASIVSIEATNPTLGAPDTNAIDDDTTRTSYFLQSKPEAIALATSLLAQGHVLDLGVAQVNDSNLAGLGHSVADAFDPCMDLQMGEKILVGGWNTALGYYGPRTSIFTLMDSTASEYNSNTLTRSQEYMRRMNVAYNSQYVREASYTAYLSRANAYADAQHYNAAARARIQRDVLAMVQLVSPPAIDFTSQPLTVAKKAIAKKKAPPPRTLTDDGFAGDWH